MTGILRQTLQNNLILLTFGPSWHWQGVAMEDPNEIQREDYDDVQSNYKDLTADYSRLAWRP